MLRTTHQVVIRNTTTALSQETARRAAGGRIAGSSNNATAPAVTSASNRRRWAFSRELTSARGRLAAFMPASLVGLWAAISRRDVMRLA